MRSSVFRARAFRFARRLPHTATCMRCLLQRSKAAHGAPPAARRRRARRPPAQAAARPLSAAPVPSQVRSATALEAERRLWFRVRHANVVQLLSSYQCQQTLVLVTDLCDGGCLLDRLEDSHTFDEQQARLIANQASLRVPYAEDAATFSVDGRPPPSPLHSHVLPCLVGP